MQPQIVLISQCYVGTYYTQQGKDPPLPTCWQFIAPSKHASTFTIGPLPHHWCLSQDLDSRSLSENGYRYISHDVVLNVALNVVRGLAGNVGQLSDDD